jgi:hypothetical protein
MPVKFVITTLKDGVDPADNERLVRERDGRAIIMDGGRTLPRVPGIGSEPAKPHAS